MMFTMIDLKYLIPLITSVVLVGCSGSSTEATTEAVKADKVPDTMTPVDEPDIMIPTPVVKVVKPIPVDPSIVFTLSFTATKVFHFAWEAVPDATSYKIREAVTVASGYETTPILETTDITTRSFDHLVPLYARLNAKYMLESCNAADECKASTGVFTSEVVSNMTSSIGYFKASNAGANDLFGNSVSLSEDGTTLAVGAWGESSSSKEIDTGQSISTARNTGAVYVFTRNKNNNALWSEEAYLKANNADEGDFFGGSVSLSADGNTLAVGAAEEDNNGANSGAAYVFTRTDATWTQLIYLKASNIGAADNFGKSVSLSADGNTLAVGATGEDSNSKEKNIGQDNNLQTAAGAVYVFTRKGTLWPQQVYLKAGNAGSNASFGYILSLSTDGNTLAVGAPGENSGSQVINEGADDLTTSSAGAAYVFTRNDAGWTQQAYLKASNAGEGDRFGESVSISGDGNTLAVSSIREDSPTTGVSNILQDDGLADDSGAAYVFTRNDSAAWSQQAYLKASNAEAGDRFGFSVSISADGNTLAASSQLESSDAMGINGAKDNGASTSGAVYTFTRSGETWSQQAYLKASNTGASDNFGYSVALSSDGDTLAAGAKDEDSNAMVNADQTEGVATDSGAVYVY